MGRRNCRCGMGKGGMKKEEGRDGWSGREHRIHQKEAIQVINANFGRAVLHWTRNLGDVWRSQVRIPPVASQVKWFLYPSSPWETSLWLKGPGSKNKHFCLKIKLSIIIKLGSSDLRLGDRRTSEQQCFNSDVWAPTCYYAAVCRKIHNSHCVSHLCYNA